MSICVAPAGDEPRPRVRRGRTLSQNNNSLRRIAPGPLRIKAVRTSERVSPTGRRTPLAEGARTVPSEGEDGVSEGQLFWFHAPGEAGRLVIASATPKKSPRVGDRLEVESKGAWYPARVLEEDGRAVEEAVVRLDDPRGQAWGASDSLRGLRGGVGRGGLLGPHPPSLIRPNVGP